MKTMCLLTAATAFLSSGLIGCGVVTSPPATGSATADDSSAKSANPDKPSAEEPKNTEISAEIASWEETQKYIAKQKGKVVVLDAWSTSCAPCIKELPNLVALQKKYPQRVVCVTLNLDYYGDKKIPPEAGKEAALKTLREVNADMHNIISSTADQEFYDSFDLSSIPAVFVYGPDGKLKKRFDNETAEYGEEGFNYEKHIVPLVEELLPKE